MNKIKICFLFIAFAALISCHPSHFREEDMNALARSRIDDIRLCVYITAQAVDGLLSTDRGRREAISVLRANGISKVYIEVYRSGLVVPVELLKSVADFFQKSGVEVAGGIATVPGDNFGVRQEARFSWFNWQNKKTQEDLKRVMKQSAPLFDEFIVDDFLCTADTSMESKTAKGDRTWPEYRRDLLVRLSKEIFVETAHAVNPDIQMIIKYPQWYDRYHLFGYDVARQPEIFDRVWIGTETRGQYTPRFGFVQPYEGFINFRWMSALAGKKMGGAWFDHIDCTDKDFIDQAYQSVLGGASELILFNYFNFTEGHPGQHLLRMDFDFLADLAGSIGKSPVSGIPAYKPPNSDAGSDLYVMDYIGMYGVPVIPVPEYPEDAPVLFLPTQAASDPEITRRIAASIDRGSRIIMTTGFIRQCSEPGRMAEIAGIMWPPDREVFEVAEVMDGDLPARLETKLKLEGFLRLTDGTGLLNAVSGDEKIPYFCRNKAGNVFVLNAHTFSTEDFDAAGEVLLCPEKLGMLDIPRSWVNVLRQAFIDQMPVRMDAPARISLQPFGDQEMMIQNYNEKSESITLIMISGSSFMDKFTGALFNPENGELRLNIPGRSRVWLMPYGKE